MDERCASIMIFQHPDRRLGEAIAVPARRVLQDEVVISDRIVSPRDPFLVDAKDVIQIAYKWHESRSRLGCFHRETSVVLGEIDLGKPAIGRLDHLAPLKPQQWRQAFLQSVPDPLHSSARLRAVGSDVFDVQILERLANLCQPRLVDFLLAFGVKK